MAEKALWFRVNEDNVKINVEINSKRRESIFFFTREAHLGIQFRFNKNVMEKLFHHEK